MIPSEKFVRTEKQQKPYSGKKNPGQGFCCFFSRVYNKNSKLNINN